MKEYMDEDMEKRWMSEKEDGRWMMCEGENEKWVWRRKGKWIGEDDNLEERRRE